MMQKKLIVLAVAAAFSAPAFADSSHVTVYGKIDMAYSSTSNGTSAAGLAGSTNGQVSSQVSKLGIKGSEDLGGGLTAIWKIEQQIDLDNSSKNGNGSGAKNSFATRNTYLGLKSKAMGTVLLGRHDTPYKIATRKLDVFSDTLADNRAIMGGSTTAGSGAGAMDARIPDMLAYFSPAMSGFTLAAAYVAGAEQATLSTQTKGAAWSFAGLYKSGPLFASLAYQVFDFGSVGTGQFAGTANDKFKAVKLGVGYKFDALQVNAILEQTDYTNANGAVDTVGRTDWYLAGKYSFNSSDAIKLAYAKAGNSNNLGAGVANGANQVSIGYDHKLSKRTMVYAQYSRVNNDTGASYTLSKAGSTAGAQALTGSGANPSAFSLGMRHSF